MNTQKELIRLFDSLDEHEFDELVGDVEIALDNTALSAENGKGHKKMNKGIKKKTSAVIIVLAAAIGITAVSAASLTSGFMGADHDKAVQKVLGDSAVSSGKAQTDSTGHLKIRSEQMLCDGRYALFAVSLEPIDEIGQQYVNENTLVGLDMGRQYDENGKILGFNGAGGGTTNVVDGCLFTFNCLEIKGDDGFDIGDKTLTGTATLELGMTTQSIIDSEGEPISAIDYEIRKNLDLITLKGDKGDSMELSGISMTLMPALDEDSMQPVGSLRLLPELINIGHNDRECFTVEYSDGTKDTYTGNDTMNGFCYRETANPYVNGFDLLFKRQIDTSNILALTINGEHFTVEQN